MNILIVYSDKKYEPAKKFCSFTGRYIARFDKVITYSPEDIDPIFAIENENILSNKRGIGLWLWKPYFIKRTLDIVKDGDYVFYADSGTFFVKNCRYIINTIDETDVWCYDLPFLEKQFTKKKVIQALECDTEKFKESCQISATLLCFRKSKFSLSLVNEWLELCKNETLLGPSDNKENEDPLFISHREDQSILSLLLKKRNVKPHLIPHGSLKSPELYFPANVILQNIEHPLEYPVCILIHKRANVSLYTILKKTIVLLFPHQFVKRW
jgi:hypothetical protein